VDIAITATPTAKAMTIMAPLHVLNRLDSSSGDAIPVGSGSNSKDAALCREEIVIGLCSACRQRIGKDEESHDQCLCGFTNHVPFLERPQFGSMFRGEGRRKILKEIRAKREEQG